jgi:hypothetical protein
MCYVRSLGLSKIAGAIVRWIGVRRKEEETMTFLPKYGRTHDANIAQNSNHAYQAIRAGSVLTMPGPAAKATLGPPDIHHWWEPVKTSSERFNF